VVVCAVCGEEVGGRGKFCPECGSPLAPAELQREVRKTVTVVFTDLVNSSALAEQLDPETVRRILGRYFAAASHVIQTHGGTVEKFIGDAVMAVFGVPAVHEDDALRAVTAAHRMREALGALNADLEREHGRRLATRTGVNTGDVVAGEARSGDLLVTGEAVNIAARLEQAAGVDEIILGEATYHLVRDLVDVDPLGDLSVKGRDTPVAAYRLAKLLEGDRIEPRRVDSPLTGRDEDRALLVQTYSRVVKNRRSQLVTLLGTAGVGKSRLRDEFLASVGSGPKVLRGRCLPYGEGITFWPLFEILREAAGIAPTDDPEEARDKLARLLGEADEARAVETVAGVMGLGGEPGPPEELFLAVRTILEKVAAAGPLVVIFDDLHWAESMLLDLVESLADSTHEAPILLLCLARPELLDLRPQWGGGRLNSTTMLVEPLSAAESEALIGQMLGGAITGQLATRVAAAAEGNPLFIEELVAVLIDDGAVRQEGERWRPSSEAAEMSIPATIQALLAARLDRLDPDERAVIERAAVIGKVFSRGGVVSLTPPDEQPRLGELLAQLERKQLVVADGSGNGQDEIRFRHLLMRDAAYASLSKAARADLHERVAQWIQETASARLPEYEEIVGYHLEQAHHSRAALGQAAPDHELAGRAASHLGAAGRRALARSDLPAAINLLERASALLSPGDRARSELLPDLGSALTENGDFLRAEEVFSEAAESARELGDARLQSRAAITRLHLQLFTAPEGASELARRAVERAIPVFEEHRDEIGLAKSWRRLALVHRTRRRFASMEDSLHKAIQHARVAGDRREESRSTALLATSYLYGPTQVSEAIRLCEEMVAGADGDLTVERGALFGLAGLRAMSGGFDEARRLCRRRREICEELGMKVELAETAIVAGLVEMLAGRPDAAERELRAGFEALNRLGAKNSLALAGAMLARAVVAQKRIDEAIALSTTSEGAAASDDLIAQQSWRSARAIAVALRGDLDTSERLAREAVALAQESDGPQEQGDAWADLSEVLSIAGRTADASHAAGTAARLYEEKGNRVSADAAMKLAGDASLPDR